jgi:hypothetical protein
VEETSVLRNLKTALAVAGLAVTPLMRGAIVPVDTFDGPLQVASVGFGGGNPVTVGVGIGGLPTVVGGSRYVQVTRDSGALNDTVVVVGGVFSLLLGTDPGSGLIIWDGDTNSSVDSGLLVDLTSGGTNWSLYTSLRSDLVAPITFTLYSASGSSRVSFFSPGLGFGATPFTNVNLPFTGFVIDSGAGVDFTAVTAITAFLDGSSVPGLDVEIDFVQGGVPEPATFALVGTVLLGIGLIRRKR